MPSFHPISDQLQTHHLPRHAPWGFFSQFQCKCCADSLLGRWAAALLGVQLHEPFPQQQRQFTRFAPTFGHLLLALHHALYCTLDCAETALCGDVRWAKIETTTKKNPENQKALLSKSRFPDPVYRAVPPSVGVVHQYNWTGGNLRYGDGVEVGVGGRKWKLLKPHFSLEKMAV